MIYLRQNIQIYSDNVDEIINTRYIYIFKTA